MTERTHIRLATIEARIEALEYANTDRRRFQDRDASDLLKRTKALEAYLGVEFVVPNPQLAPSPYYIRKPQEVK